MNILQSSGILLSSFLTPVIKSIGAAASSPAIDVAIASLIAGLVLTAFTASPQPRQPALRVRTARRATDVYPQWLF